MFDIESYIPCSSTNVGCIKSDATCLPYSPSFTSTAHHSSSHYFPDCGAPSQAGYTIDASAGTTFESVATVDSACLDGYTGEVTTTPTVTCEADGNWTQASGCDPVGM